MIDVQRPNLKGEASLVSLGRIFFSLKSKVSKPENSVLGLASVPASKVFFSISVMGMYKYFACKSAFGQGFITARESKLGHKLVLVVEYLLPVVLGKMVELLKA